jgi:hypothetical protein
MCQLLSFFGISTWGDCLESQAHMTMFIW